MYSFQSKFYCKAININSHSDLLYLSVYLVLCNLIFYIQFNILGNIIFEIPFKLKRKLYFYAFLHYIQQIVYRYGYVGFEVVTVAAMKSSIFWDTMLCSPSKVNPCFIGTYLHLQDRRISQTRNQRETCIKQRFKLVSCLAYSLMLEMDA
jgi:hypothetical protein